MGGASMRSAARAAVADGAACLVGGTREDFGRILHDYAQSVGLVSNSGLSCVVASANRATPATAAYINAAAGHSLCYDDTSNAMMGHPTVVVLPAVLAAGEHVGCSGAEMLDAYAVGVEIAVSVSAVLAPRHYLRGWHPTGTVGGLGAAAAVARLLGLDRAHCERAIAIAATSAQGLRANFGSMAMIYHAGLAARGGVDAAYLAARGMTAAINPLTGPTGYFRMFDDLEGRPHSLTQLPTLGHPLELVYPGLDVKPYPCGSLSHRAIQAVIQLRSEHSLNPARVERIICRLPELHQAVLVHKNPASTLESRISLVYPVSVAMVNGSCNLSDFSPALLHSPEVRDLMKIITTEPLATETNRGPDLFAAPAQVVIEMDDGSSYETTVKNVKGSPHNSLSEEEQQMKFDECVVPTLGTTGATRLHSLLDSLETLTNVRHLARALTPPDLVSST
jgi:2-methylcitrate dehydratase PrpD